MNTPKVYSYTRFSTPEQAAGDSKRRQAGLAERWIAANPGYVLDTELNMSDLGISAHKGKNLAGTAALGAFLKAISDGIVPPGSTLLVENLDRVSRQQAPVAMNTLHGIVSAGVTVVTLTDGKRYTAESLGGMDFVIAGIHMVLAYEESHKKGQRVAAAWANKRAKRTLMTRAVPGWIARDGGGQLIPERAAVVRRIFEMYTGGMGKHSIAAALNTDKVPTWGIGKRRAMHWHQSYIQKILRSETVIGTMTPHTDDGTVRTPQAPIAGYYPAAIDRELWDRAQSMLGAGRTRQAVAGRVQNILGGLAKCPICGGSMTRVAKGVRSKPKLVCASAKAGGWTGCTYVSVGLDAITAALVHTAAQPWPSRTEGLDDALRDAEAGLEATLEQIDNVSEAIARRPSSALESKLAALETARDNAQAELSRLQVQASQTETRLLKKREARYRAALSAVPLDVAAANATLKECLHKVVVDHTAGVLRLHWKHNGETSADYHFTVAGKEKGAV
jgi:DNA invertase Pin-like site-specific DNA recombinase